jgi:hypothetical protein
LCETVRVFCREVQWRGVGIRRGLARPVFVVVHRKDAWVGSRALFRAVKKTDQARSHGHDNRCTFTCLASRLTSLIRFRSVAYVRRDPSHLPIPLEEWKVGRSL